uniref:Uncharacterized protein n=1 Tax=Klebsiella pneumoniae TaxID=573 RepID=A0A8B0SRR6_KLEPN|nr:hypothetical protein [Klebsiella pneumoniae]
MYDVVYLLDIYRKKLCQPNQRQFLRKSQIRLVFELRIIRLEL